MPTRLTGGAMSFRISNRFAASSGEIELMPVTLPPGRERLLTSPAATGSPGSIMTIGIVLDDRFHEAGIEKPASMEPEVCWWIPRLRRAERGATSWQYGGRRVRGGWQTRTV